VLITHRDNGHKRGEGAGLAGDYRVHGVYYAWGKGAWAFSCIDEWDWGQRDLFGPSLLPARAEDFLSLS
jgi:hypothetical protein